jgi:hypothetical protein
LANLTLAVLMRVPKLSLPIFASFVPLPTPDRVAPVRNLDPTAKLRGWKYLGDAVETIRAQAEAEDGKPAHTAAMVWAWCGELSFYSSKKTQVYSFGAALGERQSHYDLLHPNPIADAQVFRGATFVYVGDWIPDMTAVFQRIDGPIRVGYRENGVTVGEWSVWVGRGYQGFGPNHHSPPKY